MFTSKYTDRSITDAQYITEIVCEKMAAKNAKVLPYKFWNVKEWAATFKYQLMLAHGLLKIYSAKAIIAALRSPRANRLFSLNGRHIIDKIIEEEQDKLDEYLSREELTIIERGSTNEAPRPSFIKKNKLNQLDE